MTAIRSPESIKSRFLRALSVSFGEEELKTLCFDLGVDYADLPAEGKSGKARELVQYLDRRNRFLECIEAVRQLRPDVSWDEVAEPGGELLPLGGLPPRAYDHFTGRTEELKKVLGALSEPERHRLVALYGLGGIGKTALAREAADLSLRDGTFQHVVWISAKTEKFEGVGVEKLSVSDLTLDSLLDEIARQCHLPHLMAQPSEERVLSIQQVLATRPVLIVIDNLETVTRYEEFVTGVSELLRGRSKALLTSRHEVERTNVHSMRLDGLDARESVVFLHEEGRSRGVTEIVEAPREMLLALHRVTGGAPLAMRLVVGQLSRQPLELVVKDLEEALFEGQDYPFYRFVFKHSWALLTLGAKKVLVSMSVFAPAVGGPVQMVRQVSKADEAVFYSAMDELVRMSLVDFGGELGRRRYALHQLTHNFILSDIVKKWG
jgi:hypothetical protein